MRGFFFCKSPLPVSFASNPKLIAPLAVSIPALGTKTPNHFCVLPYRGALLFGGRYARNPRKPQFSPLQIRFTLPVSSYNINILGGTWVPT